MRRDYLEALVSEMWHGAKITLESFERRVSYQRFYQGGYPDGVIMHQDSARKLLYSARMQGMHLEEMNVILKFLLDCEDVEGVKILDVDIVTTRDIPRDELWFYKEV